MARVPQLLASVLLLWICASAQGPSPSASLQGLIRDSEGHPIAHAVVEVQKTDSREKFRTQTDAQGSYTFTKMPDGVYYLHATKDGYADAEIPSLFLKPGEAKAIDLTIRVRQGTQALPSSIPQFSDEPQFTVAGVTDTSNLGGHGPDTVARTRDSLAKETVSLGESAHRTGLATERETSLREAAEREPPEFSPNHQLGELLFTSGRAREAIPYLERAAAKDPENYVNAYELAYANAQAGNYTNARDQANALLAKKDDPDLHHLLGDVDEKLGDSLGAVRHYERAAQLAPSESHLFDWGAELLLHHAPEPAIEVFSKGNGLFPSSSRILLGLGAAYFASGTYDQAVLRICQASDLNPNDPAPYRFLGKIEQAQNTPSAELVERLHRFVMLQPRSAEANYYYARGLWKLNNASPEEGNAAEVESLLKTAIQIDPRYAGAELQLGVVHFDQGEYTLAIAHFQKALAIDPELEEAHFRLAQAYRQNGASDKAKEQLGLYSELQKQSAQKQERERHEIKQFVYTLRDRPAPQAQ
jgi:tetratricopeptide (TPR) repeat protein